MLLYLNLCSHLLYLLYFLLLKLCFHLLHFHFHLFVIDMKKKDLQAKAGISWASVTKLSKGETVSMEVLMKVCKTLNCDIGDIMELIPTEEDSIE